MSEIVLSSSARQRLEPYLLLSKSAKGGACVQLIKDALAAPGVYVFAELLDMPNVAELQNNEQHVSYHTLLRLFSYGTYKDYKENASTLPQLEATQLNKLKHLSIVSLSEESRTIPYDILLQYLDIPNVRELEDLIIEAIYQDVIKGKLDQKRKQLEIEYTMGRDLRPGQIDQMLEVLSAWSQTSEEILKVIDTKIVQVRDAAIENKKQKEEYEKEVERLRKEVKSNSKNVDHMEIMTGGSIDQYANMDYHDENTKGGRAGKRGPKSEYQPMSHYTGNHSDQAHQNSSGVQRNEQNSTTVSPVRTIINTTTQRNTYDRHIPQRTPDPVNDYRQLRIDDNTKKRKISVIEEDAQQEEDGRIYRAVLGKSMFPLKDTTDEIIRRINNSSPSKVQKTVLPYSTPTKRRSNAIDSPFRNSYSSSPLPFEAQMILTSPRKPLRYISKHPYKVLDAPDLQDDFYLNLVDWSSNNVLGVGLGTCVYLWSAATSRVVKLCDMASQGSHRNSAENVTSVSWMPTGSHIAVGTALGPVEIWDVQKSKRVRKMRGHTQRVGALAWNQYTVSSGSRDRLIYHRDVRVPNEYTTKLTGHRQEVCGLKWNPEGTQLASGSNDNKLLIWDSASDVPIYKFLHHTAAVKAIAWSPHSHGLLASGGGSQDKHIRFWSTSTGEALECYDTESQVCNLAWSRHSNELVSTHGYSQNQSHLMGKI
ncbi:fizzy-related protein homolog [Rhizophagus clarus]|uniref:Fizzy-related protein homolog n=1 Tax=Rhizophagus clarus TaxID=94130 RepID=A0A8H3LCJ2_9GLOM|nr:fizzy-related protein homolog [Rhizophagus clarus]